jgi:hypothetical protein
MPGEDASPGRIAERLSQHAAVISDLDAWLNRFKSLRRGLSGEAALAEAWGEVNGVAKGILNAKKAAAASQVSIMYRLGMHTMQTKLTLTCALNRGHILQLRLKGRLCAEPNVMDKGLVFKPMHNAM